MYFDIPRDGGSNCDLQMSVFLKGPCVVKMKKKGFHNPHIANKDPTSIQIHDNVLLYEIRLIQNKSTCITVC